MVIRMNLDEHEIKYGVRPEVGKQYVLIEHDNEDGYTWYHLSPKIEGVGGNMDSSVKRFHGWRGTTLGTAMYACGIRLIKDIVTYKNGKSKITLSNDLCIEN